MALHDSILGMFRKETKDPNAPKPAPGSRSEREAKIKDKAGMVISVFALFLAVNSWYGGKLSSTVLNSSSIVAQGTSGSLALPLTIVGVTQRVDNAVGAYDDVQVIFNRHQFKQAQGTA